MGPLLGFGRNLVLKEQYLTLYSIARKNNTIAHFFGSIPLNLNFRRVLVGDNLANDLPQ
jgi:hypothetical protein